MKKPSYLIFAVVIIAVLAWQSIFIVHQTQKAMLIQLGEPVEEVVAYKPRFAAAEPEEAAPEVPVILPEQLPASG